MIELLNDDCMSVMETPQQARIRHDKRRAIQKKRAERVLKFTWSKDNAQTEFLKTRLVRG